MIIKIIFTIFLIICALINCIAFILILKKKEKFSKLGEVNDPFNVFLFYQGITNCNDPEDSDYFPLSSLENICMYAHDLKNAHGLNNIKLNIVLSAVHFADNKLYLNDDIINSGCYTEDETSKLTCEDGWRRTGTCSDVREPCNFICAEERCGKKPCIASPSTVCSPGWTGKSCNKTTLYSTCKKLKDKYNVDFHILIGGAGGDTWTNINNNYDIFEKQLFDFLKENKWITGINIDIEGESMFYRSNLLGPLSNVQKLIKNIKQKFSNIKVSNSSITDTNSYCIPEITPPPSGDCIPGNYNACDFKNFSNVDWIQYQCYDNSNNWETNFVKQNVSNWAEYCKNKKTCPKIIPILNTYNKAPQSFQKAFLQSFEQEFSSILNAYKPSYKLHGIGIWELGQGFTKDIGLIQQMLKFINKIYK